MENTILNKIFDAVSSGDCFGFSRREERELVNYLIENENEYELLGNGSSRVVFSNSSLSFVFKMALSEEGCTQNDIEVNLYMEQGATNFAKIYAYSDFIIVMEKVDVIKSDFYLQPDKRPYGLTLEDIDSVVEWANDVIGYTEDNEQVGIRTIRLENTVEASIVLYDYGYLPYDEQDRNLVGNLRGLDYSNNFNLGNLLKFVVEWSVKENLPTSRDISVFILGENAVLELENPYNEDEYNDEEDEYNNEENEYNDDGQFTCRK